MELFQALLILRQPPLALSLVLVLALLVLVLLVLVLLILVLLILVAVLIVIHEIISSLHFWRPLPRE